MPIAGRAKRLAAIITCEHAAPHIPPKYRTGLTEKDIGLLSTHRSYDKGALKIAKAVSKALEAPLIQGNICRLLVDLNRSETNRGRIFGAIGKNLPANEREELLVKWHRPFRKAVYERVERISGAGDGVILISVHSFTPVLDGLERNADIGLLYDPSRDKEKRLCARLASDISRALPWARTRKNYPYRGISDGTATYLRKRYPSITALELEFNHSALNSLDPAFVAQIILGSIRA